MSDLAKNDLSKMYILTYRYGNNPFPLQKFFSSSLDFPANVIKRAKSHCETMNLRFIRVSPLLSSLEDDEKRYTSGDNLDDAKS